jgi:uncharacterized protein with PQ loop repeat
METADWIGWASSIVLLITIGRQVYVQWRDDVAQGVSKWLFIGQFAASTGFTIYSVMLDNWVFAVSNIALLITAVVGQLVTLRNRQHAREHGQ